MITLDICNASCSTLSKTAGIICVPNKRWNLNLNVFNLRTRTNESSKLFDHISYKCKCKFDGKNVIQIKFGMVVNVNTRAKVQEKNVCKKGYNEILAKRAWQNNKYLGSKYYWQLNCKW